MQEKCIVVHSGARDHYQVAQALHEKGHLESLITDLYFPDLIATLFPKFTEKRHIKSLPSKKVTVSIPAFIATVRSLLNRSLLLNSTKDLALSQYAYNVAKSKLSHLFCYSYYASYAFAQKPAFEGQKKILFQLHPHPLSVRLLLEEELKNVPAARDSILYENEFSYANDYLDQLASESSSAQKIIVASSYTAQTLKENDIPNEKITVIPYGIDSGSFRTRLEPPLNKRLRVIFVGSMVQRKGLSYLLDAARNLKSKDIEFVLCGRGFMDVSLIDQYRDIDITIKRNLSHNDLIAELHRSDVFVLPTLSEGFAHVILEAMSCGLPVITTSHSCGADIITNGKEGWIIPIRSSIALVEKLEWCVENKSMLFEMGQSAAATATQFTWEQFRRDIVKFYESVIEFK